MSSFETIDNFVFRSAVDTDVRQSPFLEKRYFYLNDNNPSSTYSTSQVQFETTVLSNNGKYNSMAEGVILLPVVITVSGETGSALQNSDIFLAFKNSNYNLVHSMNVDYNNMQVVQGVDNLNQYLVFKQHTEMSSEDEELNGSLLGYAKDSSTAWSYFDARSSEGHGICNNVAFCSNNVETLQGGMELQNRGFKKRSNIFSKPAAYGKDNILASAAYEGNTNMISTNSDTSKIYYYNCYLRLRDMPFFSQLPLIRSGVFRITLTLNNNVTFVVNKAAAGTLTCTSFSNNTSITNPLMFGASYRSVKISTGDAITEVTVADAITPCASSTIGVDKNITVKLSLGQGHPIPKCRLYVPHYSFNVFAEQEYLSVKQKRVEYLDLVQYSFDVAANSQFNQLISNGMSKMRRLIMVGMINSAGNGNGLNLAAASSPFASEPSVTSPFKLQNFNVYLGGVQLYDNSAMVYDYEQFLLELNGQQGINANLTHGLVSSRISLQDFNNNYHYIVVNLDRRLPENENTSQSLLVSGRLNCQKGITFTCFIERYKTVVIDVETGVIVG